jgi:hypothetical protein
VAGLVTTTDFRHPNGSHDRKHTTGHQKRGESIPEVFSSCKIQRPHKVLVQRRYLSLDESRTHEPQGFEMPQLVAREWERLLALQAPLINLSGFKGDVTSGHNAEDDHVGSQVIVHSRDTSGNIELVGLGEEYTIDSIIGTVYVRCLVVKTDTPCVYERIGVGQVELIKWQNAEARDRTVYLI